jgi:hypothetical protein
MHRSGTSFLASFLKEAGVEIGSDLFPADFYNPRGYFEDNEFLELDTEILHSCYPPGATGFRDWGWPENEPLDRSRLGEFAGQAAALVARRSLSSAVWGWKDPRTSLLLDFWNDLIPEARYLFVYRSPWEVMHSVARLGGTFFEARPDRGLGPWRFYNRHLLAFHRQHRERCLLLPIEALTADPNALLALVSTKLGIHLPRLGEGLEVLSSVADPTLLTRLDSRPGQASVLARVFPAEAKIWLELEEAADLTAGRPALTTSADVSAALSRGTAPPTAFSVVIRCRDEGASLFEALASVESGEPRCEPILVDDHSTEPYTLEVLARLSAAGVTVVRTDREGSPAVRNAGIAAARTAFTLTLDRPEPIRPGFVARAAAVFADQPQVGAVCSDPPLVNDAGGSGPIPELNTVIAGGGGLAPTSPALRRMVWEQCGGYDEALAAGYEDWDLLLSAAERGWLVVHLPEAVIWNRRTRDPRTKPPLSLLDHRLLLERIVARHPLLIDARLPGLLVQGEVQLLQEAERALDLERLLRAQREDLPSAAHAAKRQPNEREIEQLHTDHQAALRELERWRTRVAFMESTRAWRLRDLLVRLRRLLRQSGRPGDSPRLGDSA